ncbi:hypothetical protein [Streptomyces sp. PA5.6]|uniref:hypothetical protein n=1 Tax=Streptomyces sp. PA5.6 TaxID=3035651 RepID=UPI003904983D
MSHFIEIATSTPCKHREHPTADIGSGSARRLGSVLQEHTVQYPHLADMATWLIDLHIGSHLGGFRYCDVDPAPEAPLPGGLTEEERQMIPKELTALRDYRAWLRGIRDGLYRVIASDERVRDDPHLRGIAEEFTEMLLFCDSCVGTLVAAA